MARKIIICDECGEKRPLYAKGLCSRCYQTKRDRKDYNHKWNKENPRDRKEYFLWSTFGITLKEYDLMLEIQGNCCAICGKTPEENGRRLAVDHDHETGEIRGLLCTNCNVALGMLQDDPQLLYIARKYVLEGGF